MRSRVFVLLVVFLCLGLVQSRLSKPEETTGVLEETDQDAAKNSAVVPGLTALSSRFDRNKTLCEHLHPEDLPEECSCREPGPFSVVVECLKTFNSTFFNDTIGMKIDLNPCDPEGAKLSLDVTELDHNIDYPISGIRAGEEKNFPIPGLAIAVPGLGHVGMDAAVLITGNMDSLTLKVGLNACIALPSHIMCASSIPGLSTILPWYVLSGTYSFGDVCNSTTVLGVSNFALPASTEVQ